MSRPALELKSQIVRAGAGAGKTTNLVQHVLDFAVQFRESQGRWPRVVTTTFTRKATQELRERLLRKARESSAAGVMEFVLSRSHLQITTIHGLLYGLLIQHGHRLGLDPAFQLQDGSEALRLTKLILRENVSETPELEWLTQYFSVHQLAELMVQLMRIHNLQGSVKALDRETLTSEQLQFADIVVSNIEEQAETMCRLADSDAWKNCAAILQSALAEFKKGSHLRLLLAQVGGIKKPTFRENSPSIDPDFHEEFVVNLARWRKWEELCPEQSQEVFLLEIHQKIEAVFEKLRTDLEARVRASGVVAMEDLEGLSMRLLREAPDAVEAFAKGWDYWLIDEYQDTSPVQVHLLRSLIADRPCYRVGDPQQSIYLFRGAEVRVFDEAEREVQASGGLLSQLNKSWRSSPELVHFMNELLSKFGSGFRKMDAKSALSEDRTPVAFWAKTMDERQELAFLASRIRDLLLGGVSPQKIAILARTNQTLRWLAAELERLGYPVQIVSSGGFFERREVLDLISVLRLLINPHDNWNFVEAFRSPWFRVSEKELMGWASCRQEGESYWSCLKRQEPRHRLVLALQELFEISEEQGLLFAFEIFVQRSGLVDFAADHDPSGQRESNIWKFMIEVRDLFGRTGALHSEIIQKLESWTSTDGAQDESQAVAAFEPDKVVLMTVHASKGLEFDHVLIPEIGKSRRSVSEQKFLVRDQAWSVSVRDPESDSGIKIPRIQMEMEARQSAEDAEFFRLFYVAITRAKFTVAFSNGQEVKAGSWAEELAKAWPQTELGVQVEEFPEEPPVWEGKRDQRSWDLESFSLKDEDVRWERISVSAILQEAKGEDLSQADVTKSQVGPRMQAAVSGTILHKCFEAYHYGGRDSFLAVAQQMPAAKREAVTQALDYVLSLSEPPMLQLLETGRVEWGFHMKLDGRIVEGQVDLWGEVDGTIWVVDYKSGSPENRDKAFQQLEIYAQAIAKATSSIQVRRAVVYPLLKQTYVL